MLRVLTVAALVGVAWSRPQTLQVATSPVTPTHPTPVLVKDVSGLKIHVLENEGDYGLDVYQQEGDTQSKVSSKVWAVPGDWRPPGLEGSRIVHAERLSNGDVVIAFFSLENGLDLIILPKELFDPETGDPIAFPDWPVVWHPTLSTPTEKWKWPEDVTKPTKPYPEAER